MKKIEAILYALEVAISVAIANAMAPILFGPHLEPGDEATGIAILVFCVLWITHQIAKRSALEAIAARGETAPAETQEADLVDMEYRRLHAEVLERRRGRC